MTQSHLHRKPNDGKSVVEDEIEGLDGDRRGIYRRIFRSPQHMKYTLAFSGTCAVLLLIFTAISFLYVKQAAGSLETIYHLESDALGAVVEAMRGLALIAIVLSVMITLRAIIGAVKMSNQFYGPVTPLRMHVEELMKGNYVARVNLRKSDELHELEEALNELARVLESQKARNAA